MFILISLYAYDILIYHASWLKVFQLFKYSFFQVNMENRCEGNIILQDIEHELQKNILYHYLHCSFL